MDDIDPKKFQLFTIQFQLNLSKINGFCKKDTKYQYKLTNDNQEVYIIYPSNEKEEDGYREIETWDYLDEYGNKSNRIKSKNVASSTKPTLIQFVAKTNSNDYENDFEICFRIKSNTSIIDFEPLINDRKVIPNTSYELLPKKIDKKLDLKLYVILNSQRSFNLSLCSCYTGFAIDEKDRTDSTDPKYYEIYFKDQDQEYILYRSEIRDKKYRWSPFKFRYLNLANPYIFIRFYYYEKKQGKFKDLTPVRAPSVLEYIEFSCQSNSYKEFFKYKTKSKSIDQYLSECCTNEANIKDYKHYFIFPFIRKSPISIQKIQAVQKITAKSRHIFIDQNESNDYSYKTFSNLAKYFMTKIGFGSVFSDQSNNEGNIVPPNEPYRNLIDTANRMMKAAPNLCKFNNYPKLVNDAEFGYYFKNKKKDEKKKIEETLNKSRNCSNKNFEDIQNDILLASYQSNKRIQLSFPNKSQISNVGHKKIPSHPKEGEKHTNLNNKKQLKPIFRTYQTLFVYEYENDSDTNIDYNETYEKLRELLGFYPFKTQNESDQSHESDQVFSISGKQLKNINEGIYNLGEINLEENEKKKKDLYSGFPIIIVTLFQDNITNLKYKFWSKICNEYSFIKLICVKKEYDNQVLLKYLSELKCIYDIYVKWTTQIKFMVPVQMKTDPTDPESLLKDPLIINKYKSYFIRKRLLQLLSFDFNGWSAKKGHYSPFNYYYWRDIDSICSLREKKFSLLEDIISAKLGVLPEKEDEKNKVYATILAAATSVLYHSRGGDPYAEPCLIFALNWIKNQALQDKNNNLIDEDWLEDIILNLNQESKSDAKNS